MGLGGYLIVGGFYMMAFGFRGCCWVFSSAWA